MQLLEGVYLVQGVGFDANVYVLKDGKEITLIDTGTGLFVSNIYRLVESLGLTRQNVKRAVLTHVHIDHSGGLPKIVSDCSPKVYVYDLEAPYIESGKGPVLLATMMGVSFPPTKVDVRLKDGEIIEAGGMKLKVMSTPGHTAGSICLFDVKNSILFSGDTVFADGGFGRVDFPTGDPEALIRSIKMLAKLNVKHLLPGHMNPVMNHGNEHIKLAADCVETFI
ncbi:MAG: MBL fold metallo-hydrolase [Candidatus Atabeyarchaeum deiterrae]